MQLNISNQTGSVTEHILFEGTNYTIGRSSTSDIYVDHPQISRSHATISTSNNKWHFEDCSSSGSFHNGKRIKTLYIDSSEVIQLGPQACQFKSLSHKQLTAIDSRTQWQKQQLQQLTRQLSHCENTQILLQTAQHCLTQSLGCERAALIMLDDNKSLQHCIGFEPWMKAHQFSGSRSIISKCISSGASVAIGDIQRDTEFSHKKSILQNNIQAALCVPVKISDKISAVIYADNTHNRQYFTETEVELIKSFANLLSLRLLFQSIDHNISLACKH